MRTLATSARKAAAEVGVHLLADALEDALCPPHDARRREALGKEGDKGLGSEAASIIGVMLRIGVSPDGNGGLLIGN